MVDLKSSLTLLQEKVQLLIKRHALLEKENQQLKISLERQENLAMMLEDKFKEKENQLTAMRLNQSDMNPVEKEKMIKKIDQYIKEIDNSIKNLNP